MTRLSLLSLFSSKKDVALREQQAAILHSITMSNFSTIHNIPGFRNNPVMVIEEKIVTKRTGEVSREKNVFFFENGRPALTYEAVKWEIDPALSPAALKVLIEASRQWWRCVRYTWNADGLLGEIDFSNTAGKSSSNDKFAYGQGQLMTQRYHVGDFQGTTTALYRHLPGGEGFRYRYIGTDSGADVRACISNGKVVIRNVLVSIGKNVTDKKSYYNADSKLIREEFIEGEKVVRYRDRSLDHEGNEVLLQDSQDGEYRTVYEYDAHGNFTYRKQTAAAGWVEEIRRMIVY